jgi:hypothetical protein
MNSQCQDSPGPAGIVIVHPTDFPLASVRSRGAARALLSRRPQFIVDFETLPIPIGDPPTFEELLRDWEDQGDRYTCEQLRDNTLFRCAILKTSDTSRLIKGQARE